MPTQVVFEALVHLLRPDQVPQDHVFMARVTDERGCVTGVSTAGSKIGGEVSGAFVLVRGMSSGDVLRTGLGPDAEAETGLNEVQYIVPGAGGLGEILNNSL